MRRRAISKYSAEYSGAKGKLVGARPYTHSIPVWLRAAGALFAQNYTGRISGTVSDKSGAVIPGAAIIVTNDETQVSRKLTTDGNGYYSVTNLAPGMFSVEADANGFRKAKQTG